VTSEVTGTTLRELRLSALIVLHRQLEDLAGNLPLSSNFQDFPEELQSALDKFRRETPDVAQTLAQSYSDEPWRQFVLHLQHRLPVSTGEIEDAKILEGGVWFQRPEELESHLSLLSDALHAGGAGRLADFAVTPVRRALDTFGFHLANLDIRQNSRFHDLAIDGLLEAGVSPITNSRSGARSVASHSSMRSCVPPVPSSVRELLRVARRTMFSPATPSCAVTLRNTVPMALALSS
jgi:phosphoenolpyruvate carboxylase